MYALIDCNNFYASCERVFNYGLRGKPIAILSNNDGCVIARSEEAKKAGVTMGGPAFKLRDVFEDYDVAVLSSNYALYGDMSRRVMEVLHELTASVEPYSIDEPFVKLSVNNNKNWTQQGRHIKDTVGKWTGIPVSVGIAPSKTWPNLPMKRPKPNLNMKGYYHSPKTCKLMNY